MKSGKQVVERIENKKSVLEKKEKKEQGNKSLNYKIDNSKPDFSSKKLKNIIIIAFILFIILVCLSSLKGCSFSPSDKNDNINNFVKSTDGVSSGVNKIYDSVVYITSYNNNSKSTSGTGFAYKKSKGKVYVITNYHVIANSTTIKLILANGKSCTGEFVGGDKYLDIAVVSTSSKNDITLGKLGSSERTPLGATLFTIGTPVGDEYRGTVTKGILSGKNRLVNVSVNGVRDDYIMEMLQTDAAMSPGNSGGPLCDSNGEVIGVNSVKFVKNDVEGMAFAVPIEHIKDNLVLFEKGKKVNRPYIGINMLNMSEKSSLKKYGLNTLANSSSNSGVAVVSVKGKSSSYGKLYRGDVITKLNGTSVSDIAHLRYELFKHKIGDKVSITFERNGNIRDTKITLSSDK